MPEQKDANLGYDSKQWGIFPLQSIENTCIEIELQDAIVAFRVPWDNLNILCSFRLRIVGIEGEDECQLKQ